MRPGGLIWPLLAVVAFLVARGRLDVVVVRGRSMAPTLLPGDRLLVARLPVRVGDVVLAMDPRAPQRELIKRVTAVETRGVTLRGDNPGASTDARTFGALPAEAIAWRVVGRYWPASRIGPVGSGPALQPGDEGGEPACAFSEALIAGEPRPSVGLAELHHDRE
ncbi:MAG TPA: nickel-type superoxide dismutase maturation protease [Candidatus Limnocylindria bacterium]